MAVTFITFFLVALRPNVGCGPSHSRGLYEGRTESHEQLFLACELGTAD